MKHAEFVQELRHKFMDEVAYLTEDGDQANRLLGAFDRAIAQAALGWLDGATAAPKARVLTPGEKAARTRKRNAAKNKKVNEEQGTNAAA